MSKFRKYGDSASDLAMGVIFIIISILLLVGKDKLYKDIINIVVLIFLLLSVFQLLNYFFKRLTVKEKSKTFLSSVFNLILCFVLVSWPNFSYGILPVIFALYLFLMGSAQFVLFFLFLDSDDGGRIKQFLWGCFYYGISLPILFSPINKLDTFLNCLGIYIFLLGLTFVYDFIVSILSIKTKNNLKRKIRITLPKVLEAVIPYSVMVEINKSLDTYTYSRYNNFNGDIDLYILVHTSDKGFNRFGHVDIYFQGYVISYGNYDEGSRRYKECFGDGVMFVTKRREDYINFCIDNSKKTLFEFGVRLNNKQKEQIKKRIFDLFENTVPWNFKNDKKYNNGESYAARLFKNTNARFYKFEKGKYKTYFVLGTNCCYLIDDVVGKSGIDLLSLNGLVTPGTYYDYLEKELSRKNGLVVSKNVYNSSRKCK